LLGNPGLAPETMGWEKRMHDGVAEEDREMMGKGVGMESYDGNGNDAIAGILC
jgi:hypothetical protein